MNDAPPPRRLGRPPGSGKGIPKDTLHITVPCPLAEWLREQDGGVSATVTRLLEEAYLRENAAS